MDPEKLLQKARGINPELYEVLAKVMDKTCYQSCFLLTSEEAASIQKESSELAPTSGKVMSLLEHIATLHTDNLRVVLARRKGGDNFTSEDLAYGIEGALKERREIQIPQYEYTRIILNK